jgi:hypothetical protein
MHKLAQLRDAGAGVDEIGELFAEDAIFNSPILSGAVKGREAVAKTRVEALASRKGAYVMEMSSGNSTFLHWRGTVDGQFLESFETLLHDDRGLIVECTVAMRPFSTVVYFRNQMVAKAKKTGGDAASYALPVDLILQSV